MKRYVVTLDESEREGLKAITNKGSHRSQKVINALILSTATKGSATNDRRPERPLRRFCGSACARWIG